MIDAEAIERAERVLTVVYGQGMERQLEVLEVDKTSWDNWMFTMKDMVKRRYPDAWARMDPRFEPALNTLMTHIFLTGIVAGRNSVQGGELL